VRRRLCGRVYAQSSRRHAIAGRIFVIAMLILGSSGAYLALLKSQPGNILGVTLTFYPGGNRMGDGQAQRYFPAALALDYP
jgi:hypothetical protein